MESAAATEGQAEPLNHSASAPRPRAARGGAYTFGGGKGSRTVWV
jgi:hypothetical protein